MMRVIPQDGPAEEVRQGAGLPVILPDHPEVTTDPREGIQIEAIKMAAFLRQD